MGVRRLLVSSFEGLLEVQRYKHEKGTRGNRGARSERALEGVGRQQPDGGWVGPDDFLPGEESVRRSKREVDRRGDNLGGNWGIGRGHQWGGEKRVPERRPFGNVSKRRTKSELRNCVTLDCRWGIEIPRRGGLTISVTYENGGS